MHREVDENGLEKMFFAERANATKLINAKARKIAKEKLFPFVPFAPFALNFFLCDLCVICGRITHTRVLNQLHKEAPMSLANLAD